MKYIICFFLAFIQVNGQSQTDIGKGGSLNRTLDVAHWKWTVHWKETHGSKGLGMETMKSRTTPNILPFTDGAKARALFWSLIHRRDFPDRLDIGGEPDIIRNVRIDSVQIK